MILAGYLAAFSVLPRGVFYSPDAGGKYLQMLGYRWSNGLQCDLIYPGSDADPDFAFYGTHAEWAARAAIHPYRNETGVHTGWTPWFSLLTQPFYRAFGMSGLYVVPWLSGLLLISLSGRLAERMQPGAGLPSAFVVALASPVLFYSLCYWEHTLAAAMALAALLPLAHLKSGPVHGRRRFLCRVSGGALLLAACALRREMVFFLGAVLLAWGWVHSRRRRFLPVALAALAVAGAGGVLMLFSHPASLHWLVPSGGNNVHWLSRLLNADHWRGFVPNAVRTILLYDFDTRLPWPVRWVALTGVAACGASVAAPMRWRRGMVLIGAVLASAATAWLAFTPERHRALNSLVLPAPLALWALLPSAGGASGIRRWLGWTVVFFVGALCVVVPAAVLEQSHGGLEWGSRYALVAIVLANLLGMAAALETRSAPQVSKSMKRAVMLVAGWLILLGAASAFRGVLELRQTRRDLLALQQALERAEAPVVTDAWWLGASLAPFAANHEVFTLSAQHPFSEWLDRVGSRRPCFTFAGFHVPNGVLSDGETWIRRDAPPAAGLSIVDFRRWPDPR
ncbi:MAG: hypothetical protein AB7V14_02675 [Kiritimatiellia bacterium]